MYKISRNSWHYKMNYFLTLSNIPTDFCRYFMTTVLHSVLIIVVGFIVLSVMAILSYCAIINPLGALFIAIVLGLFLFMVYISRRFLGWVSHKEPGLIGMKYNSWKEKTCSKIEFTDV